MHACRRPQAPILVREPDPSFEVGRPFACTNHHHALDARFKRSFDYGVAIRFKFTAIQVAMRIYQHVDYFRREPTGTSSRKPASTGLPPSSEAATIMPCDSSPRNLRGCRLATMTTLRPINDSGS